MRLNLGAKKGMCCHSVLLNMVFQCLKHCINIHIVRNRAQ
nr:MAG TPA_asm: hypothetical protein [Caudoviricetes sp.]